MRHLTLIQAAAYLLMAAGFMHVVAFVLGGFSYGGQGLAPDGVLFIVVGYLLQREWRWLAYLTYIGVGIGVSFVIRDVFVAHSVPTWWTQSILVADAAVVVLLFLVLWKKPQNVNT